MPYGLKNVSGHHLVGKQLDFSYVFSATKSSLLDGYCFVVFSIKKRTVKFCSINLGLTIRISREVFRANGYRDFFLELIIKNIYFNTFLRMRDKAAMGRFWSYEVKYILCSIKHFCKKRNRFHAEKALKRNKTTS